MISYFIKTEMKPPDISAGGIGCRMIERDGGLSYDGR
jgi:hypothetical protein